MKRSFMLPSLFMTFLMLFCQKTTVQKMVFVQNGMPADLDIRDMIKEDGYLLADKSAFFKTKKAVYGNTIIVEMKMSVDEFKGPIAITVGDNRLTLTDEKAIILQGASVGKRLYLGKPSDYIEQGVPFEFVVSYQNEKLSFVFDEKELFSQDSDIPPAGPVQLEDETGSVRVYDLSCAGFFKDIKQLYTKEFLLNRAQKSLARAAKRVKADPNRPAYHFLPPANWNNDPNGLLYFDGYYHLFYQHNPYGDRWDWMHWGHARSQDMVFWEHLPIALWPSIERGEKHCFSGSGFITENGDPILFYTSIGHEHPEHWAAIPADDTLEEWEKHPANPIIVMEDHGDLHIDDWRDPFLFREDGEAYMVIGGHPRDQNGSIMLYKALNATLTEWDYLGVPFTGEERNWECPNFFKLGEKYVLIYSPHGRVEYYTGIMDFDNVQFNPEYHGFIDHGGNWNYYAPNTLQMEDGQRILFGWIQGFKEDQGWQGAISLPRDLSIDETGKLFQKPISGLAQLRENVIHKENVKIETIEKVDIAFPQFELLLEIAGSGTNEIGFQFTDENSNPYNIIIASETLYFGEEKVELENALENIQTIQFFFDRTIVEIFINGGELCATKVVYPDFENLDFKLLTNREGMELKRLSLSKMYAVW